MRESATSYPLLNRAVKHVPNYYDRSSINCPAIIPLLNSLNQLIFLTSTSAGTREQIVKDGGLEQLIYILNTTKISDVRTGWKWSMAYQCVVNIGVRGNETIRKRVVEAGIIPIVINILETFLNSIINIKNERQRLFKATNTRDLDMNLPLELVQPTSAEVTINSRIGVLNTTEGPTPLPIANNSLHSHSRENNQFRILNYNETNSTIQSQDTNEDNNKTHAAWLDKVLYREEDILLSLQLLAYLSKYPCLRQELHSGYKPKNVFKLVEMFTSRVNATQVIHWSGIIMRNACRKDEAKGGLRRCAFMSCGKWETYPREFAKCRRCRKAKYCSKLCQSNAWTEGHRYWCIERTSDSLNVESNLNSGNATVVENINSTNAQLPIVNQVTESIASNNNDVDEEENNEEDEEEEVNSTNEEDPSD